MAHLYREKQVIEHYYIGKALTTIYSYGKLVWEKIVGFIFTKDGYFLKTHDGFIIKCKDQ